MARPISGRVLVSGKLECKTAIHVGGLDPLTGSALRLARDGRGRLTVPGTSLAGVFRSWCCRAELGPGLVEALFGAMPESDNAEAEEGWASHLLVADGAITLPGAADVEIRDGVGIDRRLGAAAERVKFERELVPPGSTIELELELELPKSAARATPADFKAVLGHLLLALEAGQLRIGAASSRGLGRVELVDLEIREQDLATKAGLLEVLQGAPSSLSPAELVAGSKLAPKPRCRVEIEIEWRPRSAVFSKAPREGVVVDALPLLSECGDGRQVLLLPGSALKGALRSHAERIMRTLFPEIECPASDCAPEKRFLGQLEVRLVDWLFGTPGKKDEGGEPGDDLLRGRAAVTVEDCAAQAAIETKAWARVEAAETSEDLSSALEDAGCPGWEQSFHVAVDRFTGGAASGRLFSVLEPLGEHWQPIRLGVDLDRLPDHLRRPALALLLLVLRDLSAGRLVLGYGGNRGFGEVEVRSIRLSETGDTLALGKAVLELATERRSEEAEPVGIPPAWAAPPESWRDLEQAWTSWLDSQERLSQEESP